jgi:hypothetical protein
MPEEHRLRILRWGLALKISSCCLVNLSAVMRSDFMSVLTAFLNRVLKIFCGTFVIISLPDHYTTGTGLPVLFYRKEPVNLSLWFFIFKNICGML